MPVLTPRMGERREQIAALSDGSASGGHVHPDWLRIPPNERSGQSFESLLRSYRGTDGALPGFDRKKLSGDQLLRAYSLVRQSFLNGRGLDFERALASTNLGAGYEDGTALSTLNLDTTMTSVLYDNQHLVMWNWFNRVPSINPLYQWTERNTYGSIRGGFGFAQGGVPRTGVAAWGRMQATVCFFGVRRGITDVEAQSGLLGGVMVDPVQEEDRDGAFQLLGRAELNFTFADPLVTDDYGNTVNFPGIVLQMTDLTGTYSYGRAPAGTNVYDLQGRYLNFTDLNAYASQLYDQGKLGSFANLRLFAPAIVLEDLSNLRNYVERRVLAPETPEGRAGMGYVTGTPIPGHATNFGFIPFTASIFLQEVPDGHPINSGDPEQGAPAIPSITSATPGSPGSGVTSYFVAENGLGQSDAGTYYYWVSAVNDSGESFPSGATTNASGEITGATSTAATVAVGQVVVLTCSLGPSNGQVVTQLRVYRGTVNSITDPGTTIIGHVPCNPVAPPSSVSFTDTNSTRSGTNIALLLERTPNNLAIAQMAPMTKYPLAIVQTKVEWLLLLYHVLVIKARQRAILVKNIGRFTVGV
jgi:hypothetical protein